MLVRDVDQATVDLGEVRLQSQHQLRGYRVHLGLDLLLQGIHPGLAVLMAGHQVQVVGLGVDGAGGEALAEPLDLLPYDGHIQGQLGGVIA